jgi:hypothetical protein
VTVDIRLNQMIDALDGRLKGVPLEDVELSVRTFKALKDCGAHTLHDAQMALINRTLHKQHGIGPRAVKEVEEIIASVCMVLPPVFAPQPKERWQPIETAPKDRCFLACVDPTNRAEAKLIGAIFGEQEYADYREIVIAHKRKGDPKYKVRTDPHGRRYDATHWMELPQLPAKKGIVE